MTKVKYIERGEEVVMDNYYSSEGSLTINSHMITRVQHAEDNHKRAGVSVSEYIERENKRILSMPIALKVSHVHGNPVGVFRVFRIQPCTGWAYRPTWKGERRDVLALRREVSSQYRGLRDVASIRLKKFMRLEEYINALVESK